MLHVEFVDLIKSAVMEIDLLVALVNAVERTASMTMRMTKMTRGMTNEACSNFEILCSLDVKILRAESRYKTL